jgi:hypothetical protein
MVIRISRVGRVLALPTKLSYIQPASRAASAFLALEKVGLLPRTYGAWLASGARKKENYGE